MFSFSNSANMLIGKRLSRTASVQYTDPSNTSTYIADGEIVVLNGDTGAVLSAGSTIATCKSIKLVQGRGTNTDQPLVFSARIFGLNVTSFTGLVHVPEQEQITNIGYNGTTGSIDNTVIQDQYTLRLQYKHDKAFWSEQKMIRSYFYDATTAALTTQKAIAVKNAQDVNADPATLVSAEILNDAAVGAISNTGVSIVVSNGSKTATVTAGTVAVNDVLRIGNPGTAKATTVGMYIVSSVSGTTVTLNMPYQGTSGTVLTTDWGIATVGTNWGVKLTGKALQFTPGFWKYVKVAWDTVLTNYTSTTLADAQQASKGNGMSQSVRELEWFLLGYEGAVNRMMIPLDSGRTDAVSTTDYSTVTINYFDTSESYPVSGTHPAPQMLYLALRQGVAQNAFIAGQLNPWMASLPSAFNALPVGL